ncbi:AAA family ATPase [Candidatus Shapirobacteria bacterium CG03_land_8_20_14_0_80_39_12]|uniref:AAA family ATPase n=1 Tax=Candidatus Shapirobacteria bacterium CG03_land_8_20_14_0_80_39_12 TaxID=1974879 RepID=A0A2M7BET7_9BACT|nr:MAG: AAA family ATPase [Candidatus Shapirobacteria bacterium CG03_land_8_20_14_0_80_39_12]
MDNSSPLADRLRPTEFADFVGQEHLVGPNGLLRKLAEKDELVSLIFWGPPGCGKTTLAKIIASKTKSYFVHFSAVSSGIDEVKKVVAQAGERKKLYGQRTILFVDEIHRFNKLQQDAFLPYVEDGTIILIGATTENPSFEVIGPLLSRCRVFVLESLGENELNKIIDRGIKELNLKIEPDARAFLIEAANGDARNVLNILEIAEKIVKDKITLKDIEEAMQKKTLLYDKAGEEHYNLISAVHKAMRGSDPDAAIYYICRMLEAGEDPLYVARRMVRFASEDIGNADPEALQLAVAAFEACDRVGMPECRIFLVQLAAYLALAPKDNAAYLAEGAATEDIKRFGNLPVPLKFRNPVTKLMKEIGYGEGYKYAHNFRSEELKDEVYLPDRLKGKKYYLPKKK